MISPRRPEREKEMTEQMSDTSGTRLEKNTVFVLGAGFTKAVMPLAPLLVDDYGATTLLSEFEAFPTARAILDNEIDVKNPHKFDLEIAMTRASAGMPYDSATGAAEQLSLLFAKLKQVFESRLQAARKGEVHTEELAAFARFCLDKSITCITFNYDDLLDEFLWRIEEIPEHVPSIKYWYPDSGYGFFCRPAWSMSGSVPAVRTDNSAMLLLKLHGSVNWRIRLGYSSHLSPDALVHSESWFPRLGVDNPDAEELERHMEPSPFLIPPVLTKDVLVAEPILRLVWARAFQALRTADLVVFIGYSLPVTDIAARFLFTEAIRSEARLRIVNYARNKTQQEELRATYRTAFPDLRYDQFSFDGALEWSRAMTRQYLD